MLHINEVFHNEVLRNEVPSANEKQKLEHFCSSFIFIQSVQLRASL